MGNLLNGIHKVRLITVVPWTSWGETQVRRGASVQITPHSNRGCQTSRSLKHRQRQRFMRITRWCRRYLQAGVWNVKCSHLYRWKFSLIFLMFLQKVINHLYTDVFTMLFALWWDKHELHLIPGKKPTEQFSETWALFVSTQCTTSRNSATVKASTFYIFFFYTNFNRKWSCIYVAFKWCTI